MSKEEVEKASYGSTFGTSSLLKAVFQKEEITLLPIRIILGYMVHMCGAQHVDFDHMHLYVSYFPFIFIHVWEGW